MDIILMVAPTGIEPVTLGLEVPCSIQLSYGATLLYDCLHYIKKRLSASLQAISGAPDRI
jgi:hypothetical protein